jgi:PIN domain nuclease of toxin-antitoxin system
MNLLLDANVLIWLGTGSKSLTVRAVTAIHRADRLFYSAISVAEIAMKIRKGGLTMQPDLRTYMASLASTYQMECLDFDDASALELQTLPLHHRDPFDRMLICQALAHKLDVVTSDHAFSQYPIRVLW